MNQPTTWNKMLYNQFISGMHSGLADMKADCPDVSIEDAVGDIANDIMESDKNGWQCDPEFPQKGLIKFMEDQGIRDTQGRLADDIYSGSVFRK